MVRISTIEAKLSCWEPLLDNLRKFLEVFLLLQYFQNMNHLGLYCIFVNEYAVQGPVSGLINHFTQQKIIQSAILKI